MTEVRTARVGAWVGGAIGGVVLLVVVASRGRSAQTHGDSAPRILLASAGSDRYTIVVDGAELTEVPDEVRHGTDDACMCVCVLCVCVCVYVCARWCVYQQIPCSNAVINLFIIFFVSDVSQS